MVRPGNIDSGRSNSQLGDRSRCRHCNLNLPPKADIRWVLEMSALCQKQTFMALFDHILNTEWKSAVNFAKYDVERAEYRRDISEHVSAS
jgi:hypothetical protein